MKQRDVKDETVLKEKISALLDDELSGRDREKLLKMVSRDKRLADLWNRYHVIGASVRRELVTLCPELMQCVGRMIHHDRPGDPPKRQARSGLFGFEENWKPAGVAALSLMIAVVLGIYIARDDIVPATIQDTATTAVDGSTRWVNTHPEHEEQLNAFLVEHGEFTPMSGLNGLVSYAKFVSYDEK